MIDLPEEGHGNRPFTIKTTPCGEPGYYMHFTPEYLLDEQVASEFGEYPRVCKKIIIIFDQSRKMN